MPSPQLDYVPATPSEVNDGQQIKVTGTASGSADLLHTATSETSGAYDVVYIAACNTHTADVLLTIEWGGTSADDKVTIDLPPNMGMVPVVVNHRIRNALDVKAYASVANVVNVYIDALHVRGVQEP